MKRVSNVLLLRAAAVLAGALLVLPCTMSGKAGAADLKVLISTALKSSMAVLTPQFEQASERKLDATFAASTSLKKQIDGGEAFDATVLTPDLIDALSKAGKLDSGSIARIARTGIGVAIRAGAPKPDISTVAALKRTLLDAKSITYGDPTRGGLSSVHFAGVLDRLGIAAEMKPKTLLISAGEGVQPVAEGKAEIGIGQMSEILLIPGAVLLGPLPDELQLYTNLSAGISINARDREGARALIDFLTGPAVGQVLKSKGMERW
jgi:molybdate transport system substrate-binding protein